MAMADGGPCPDATDLFRYICTNFLPEELSGKGVQNEAIEAELQKRTELIDELRNLLARLFSPQNAPPGPLAGSVLTATHSISQRTATIRSTSTSVTKMHYQRTKHTGASKLNPQQHAQATSQRSHSFKPVEAMGSGDHNRVAGQRKANMNVNHQATGAHSQAAYCPQQSENQYSVPHLGLNVRSSHGHEHPSPNMAGAGQFAACGCGHGRCNPACGMTVSPTMANLLGLINPETKQNSKWHHQTCAPSAPCPQGTVPMNCPPGNPPTFIPRETSHDTTVPGSLGDHPRPTSNVELKRTISRLIRSFKKNLEEIVEAKEACTAAGDKVAMSRSELADFVRREIKKALSSTKESLNASRKDPKADTRRMRSVSSSSYDVTSRSQAPSEAGERQKTRHPAARLRPNVSESSVPSEFRHPYVSEPTPERLASPCNWYDNERPTAYANIQIKGKDSFTQTSYNNLPPHGIKPQGETSCFFYTQSAEAVQVHEQHHSRRHPKPKCRNPSRSRTHTVVRSYLEPSIKQPPEIVPKRHIQPIHKHVARSNSAASSLTLESQSWTRELTRIIDESLFVNIKTTADKAVESEQVKQQDAEVQLEPAMLDIKENKTVVEHKDQMVMTDDLPETKPVTEARSEVAVQTEQEVPVKEAASTPSVPASTGDFSQTASSAVESESSSGVEQKVVDVLKAWLKTPDFQDIISESITSKLKTTCSVTSVSESQKEPVKEDGDADKPRTLEGLLAKRAAEKTAVDTAWESLLGMGPEKPVAAPIHQTPALLTPSTKPSLPDFEKLHAARQSLFAAGQRALMRPEAVRQLGGPMPFTAADAVSKGPPAPHETFSLSQHLELKKRLEVAAKSFKKPSDIILEEATKAISLEPRREALQLTRLPQRRCQQVLPESMMLEAPPSLSFSSNPTDYKTSSVGTEEPPRSELDEPLSSTEDLDEDYTLASNNSALDDEAMPPVTISSKSKMKTPVTSMGDNLQQRKASSLSNMHNNPQPKAPEVALPLRQGSSAQQIQPERPRTQGKQRGNYGKQVLSQLMEALNQPKSRKGTEDEECDLPVVESMSSSSNLGSASLPSSQEFAVNQSNYNSTRASEMALNRSSTLAMPSTGSQTFMPTTPMSNYARNRLQASAVPPAATCLEDPSESESSIPSWLERPRKTAGVILDGTRRVILEAHDLAGIQKQYVVSTAEDQSLQQADNSEKSGVIIKTMSLGEDPAIQDYCAEDEEATHNDVPKFATITASSKTFHNSLNDWTSASLNQLSKSVMDDDEGTLRISAQDHLPLDPAEVKRFDYHRRIHPGARSYASEDDDETAAESVEVPDDQASGFGIADGEEDSDDVDEPAPVTMLKNEINEWVEEENLDRAQLNQERDQSDRGAFAVKHARSSQSSRTYPGTEDWVPNHPSQAELNKKEWDEKWGQPFQESDDEEYYDPEEELYEDKEGDEASDEDEEEANVRHAFKQVPQGQAAVQNLPMLQHHTRYPKPSDAQSYASSTQSEQDFGKVYTLRHSKEMSDLRNLHAMNRELESDLDEGNIADDDETYSRPFNAGGDARQGNWKHTSMDSAYKQQERIFHQASAQQQMTSNSQFGMNGATGFSGQFGRNEATGSGSHFGRNEATGSGSHFERNETTGSQFGMSGATGSVNQFGMSGATGSGNQFGRNEATGSGSQFGMNRATGSRTTGPANQGATIRFSPQFLQSQRMMANREARTGSELAEGYQQPAPRVSPPRFGLTAQIPLRVEQPSNSSKSSSQLSPAEAGARIMASAAAAHHQRRPGVMNPPQYMPMIGSRGVLRTSELDNEWDHILGGAGAAGGGGAAGAGGLDSSFSETLVERFKIPQLKPFPN